MDLLLSRNSVCDQTSCMEFPPSPSSSNFSSSPSPSPPATAAAAGNNINILRQLGKHKKFTLTNNYSVNNNNNSTNISNAMFLDKNQLENVLKNSFFSQPFTESAVQYELYRGHLSTSVHTLRFNFTANFNEYFIVQTLIKYLFTHYIPNTQLIGSMSYDLLLKDPNSNPTSYYIWRANSNAVHFSADNEFTLYLTHNNIYRLVQNCSIIHVPSLEIFFRSSNVVIERPLAVVFSFFKI